jgi:hypothetical protein
MRSIFNDPIAILNGSSQCHTNQTQSVPGQLGVLAGCILLSSLPCHLGDCAWITGKPESVPG